MVSIKFQLDMQTAAAAGEHTDCLGAVDITFELLDHDVVSLLIVLNNVEQ